MKSPHASVEAYLRAVPPERTAVLQAVRETILANLAPGFAEGMSYGMIGYFVPLSAYEAGYLGNKDIPLPFAALASQKNHLSLYLYCHYADPRERARFTEDWKRSGKKLDMGKSCVRFRTLADIDLPAVARAIRRISVKDAIRLYEAARRKPRPARR